MGKRVYLECFVTAIATLTIVLSPTSLVAGGYGSAGVSDAPVSQYAGQDKVWCQRLDANVPGRLYQQMDCGSAETGIARSAVAGERVTNRPGVVRDFFRSFRHVPRRSISTDDDNPSPSAVIVREDNPKPTPVPTSKPDKWDRLNELGVSSENYDDQSQEFKEQVGEYRSTHGADGDWSDFNPNKN